MGLNYLKLDESEMFIGKETSSKNMERQFSVNQIIFLQNYTC